jgi:hypothetical protein
MPSRNVQWNLDLLFFKGVEKTYDEYGEAINRELRKKSYEGCPESKF